jgi:hypothetical protein
VPVGQPKLGSAYVDQMRAELIRTYISGDDYAIKMPSRIVYFRLSDPRRYIRQIQSVFFVKQIFYVWNDLCTSRIVFASSRTKGFCRKKALGKVSAAGQTRGMAKEALSQEYFRALLKQSAPFFISESQLYTPSSS